MKRILIAFIILSLMPTFSKGQVGLPYFNDFETDTAGWSVETLSGNPWIWDFNTSNFCTGFYGFQLSPGTGMNTQSHLISPVFDLNGITNPQICLSHKRTLNSSQDGMRIDYNLNGSGIWNVLGNTLSGSQWYGCPFIPSSGLPGWCGISGPSCSNSSMSLAFLAGNATVQFRFVPSSSTGNIGLYYLDSFTLCDNFCPCSMGVGLNETSAHNCSLSFTPNPASDKTTLNFHSQKSELAQLKLYNQYGATVYSRCLDLKSGQNEIQLDFSGLNNGCYYAHLQGNEIYYSVKLIKAN